MISKPIKTLVYHQYLKLRHKISLKPFPGAIEHFALWRPPLYGDWTANIDSRANPYEIERQVWQVYLQDTSLVPSVTFEQDFLSPETFNTILSTVPASLPSALVRQFLDSTYLTRAESNRIERECDVLWAGSGRLLRNPHPLLEEVVTAMGLHEKLGIQTWQSLDEIPVKKVQAIRLVLNTYASLMALNEQARSSRARAIKDAGIEKFVTGKTRTH